MSGHHAESRSSSGGSERITLINFLLDESGSMEWIADAAISGFNEFKNDQAAEEGQALLTLTLFDTRFRTVCEAIPAREVTDLDRSTYRPRGMTALFDAIGHTMRLTDDFVAEHHPDQVVFVIMTDGHENSSQEFTKDAVFDMIDRRQKESGYEFIYLGANQDSYAVGSELGVRDGRTLDYDSSSASTVAAMKRASTNVKAHRRMGGKQSKEFFGATMEALGSIDSASWAEMQLAEKERIIRESRERLERRREGE